MAAPNGYGTSIRQGLINKGINNNDIGFNNKTGFVTVKGQDFAKAPKVVNGQAFDTQFGFDKAWNSFAPTIAQAANNVKNGTAAPKPNPNVTQTATTLAKTFSAPAPQSRLETVLGNLTDAVNTPFSYNPENDAAFQAYKQQALNDLETTQANTNARLRAGGQGKSSYSETLAHQLGNQAAQNIENTMIQQYLPMAYQQYGDRINNLNNLYNTAYTQDVTRPLSIAQQTGTYQDPEMMKLYNTVLQAKQNYAAASTPEERSAANQAAEIARQQIRMLGGNPDLIGADVTYDQALGNQNKFGIRTLAGLQQDQAEKDSNLNAALAVGNASGRLVSPQTDWNGLYRQASDENTPLNMAGQQFAYQQGRDLIGDQQWAANFGLQKAAQAISQQVSLGNLSINQAQLLMQQAEMLGYITPQLAAVTGMPEGTPLVDSKSPKAAEPVTAENYESYLKGIARYDEDGNLANPDQVESAIYASNASNYEKGKMLLSKGFKLPDGQTLDSLKKLDEQASAAGK